MKAINRNQLQITHAGAITIAIGHHGAQPGYGQQASMVCVACDALMGWDEQSSVFLCPGCDYDMTASEADELCGLHLRKIKALRKYIPGRRSWWSRVFGS